MPEDILSQLSGLTALAVKMAIALMFMKRKFQMNHEGNQNPLVCEHNQLHLSAICYVPCLSSCPGSSTPSDKLIVSESWRSTEAMASMKRALSTETAAVLLALQNSWQTPVPHATCLLGIDSSPREGSLQSFATHCTGIAAAVLGDAVDPSQPLMEAGLDSLAAVELRNAIASAFSITLPTTLAFDFPTMAAIAQHISDQSAAAADDPQEAAAQEVLDKHLLNADALDDFMPDAKAALHLDSGISMSDLLRATTMNLQSIVADIAGQVIEEQQPMAEVWHTTRLESTTNTLAKHMSRHHRPCECFVLPWVAHD